MFFLCRSTTYLLVIAKGNVYLILAPFLDSGLQCTDTCVNQECGKMAFNEIDSNDEDRYSDDYGDYKSCYTLSCLDIKG